jgi:hypothetical protein
LLDGGGVDGCEDVVGSVWTVLDRFGFMLVCCIGLNAENLCKFSSGDNCNGNSICIEDVQ